MKKSLLIYSVLISFLIQPYLMGSTIINPIGIAAAQTQENEEAIAEALDTLADNLESTANNQPNPDKPQLKLTQTDIGELEICLDEPKECKLDRRTLELLAHLTTLAPEGKGHTLKISRIRKNYTTEKNKYSKESESEEQQQANTSAHYYGQAIDIEEIDTYQCTKKGWFKKKKLAPEPIKVAYQSEDSGIFDPYQTAPKLTGSSLVEVSEGVYIDQYTKAIAENLGMDPSELNFKDANFSEVMEQLGKSAFKEETGFNFPTTKGGQEAFLKNIGAQLAGKKTGLPAHVFYGETEDISRNIVAAKFEQRAGLLPGSLFGKNTEEMMENAGLRLMEAKAGLEPFELTRDNYRDKLKASSKFNTYKSRYGANSDKALNLPPGTLDNLTTGDGDAFLLAAGIDEILKKLDVVEARREAIVNQVKAGSTTIQGISQLINRDDLSFTIDELAGFFGFNNSFIENKAKEIIGAAKTKYQPDLYLEQGLDSVFNKLGMKGEIGGYLQKTAIRYLSTYMNVDEKIINKGEQAFYNALTKTLNNSLGKDAPKLKPEAIETAVKTGQPEVAYEVMGMEKAAKGFGLSNKNLTTMGLVRKLPFTNEPNPYMGEEMSYTIADQDKSVEELSAENTGENPDDNTELDADDPDGLFREESGLNQAITTVDPKQTNDKLSKKSIEAKLAHLKKELEADVRKKGREAAKTAFVGLMTENLSDVSTSEDRYNIAATAGALFDKVIGGGTVSSESYKNLFTSLGGKQLAAQMNLDPTLINLDEFVKNPKVGLPVALDYGTKYLERSLGLELGALNGIYTAAPSGQINFAPENAVANLIKTKTGITNDEHARWFVTGQVDKGLQAAGAAALVKSLNKDVPDKAKISYDTIADGLFGNSTAMANAQEKATEKLNKDADTWFNENRNTDPNLANPPINPMRRADWEKEKKQEYVAARQDVVKQAGINTRKQARKNAQYAIMDSQLIKANPDLPVGFSRAMFEGTDKERIGVISEFALAKAGISDEKLSEAFGTEVPPGTAANLANLARTQDFESFKKDMGNSFEDFAANKAFAFGDKKLGVEAGTTAKMYNTYKQYQQIEQAQAAGTISAGQARNSEIALAITVVDTLTGGKITKMTTPIDDKLGLPPGTFLSVTTHILSGNYIMAAVVLVTAILGIGEIKCPDTKALAQEKVRTLNEEILDFARTTKAAAEGNREKMVVPSQILTYRDEDINHLRQKYEDIFGPGGVNYKAGIFKSLNPREIHVGF